jgi:cyclophilin family peptidyl-prolyl cis-trans isomerase
MRMYRRTALAVLTAALAIIGPTRAAAQTAPPKESPPPKTAPKTGTPPGTAARPAAKPPAGTQAKTGAAKPAAKPGVAKAPAAAAASPTPGAGPVIVVETSKGAFEFETYPDDAPKTVANFVALTKKGFYNGQRFHRVVPGFVIQAGDPQTRDMSKREQWGRGAAAGSGKPVGVAEFSKTHLHTTGAVAMAHAGDAAQADSQFYVTLGPKPALNGKYAVFGHVISGADVPAKIEVGDVIKRMYVKTAPAK